MMIVRSFLLVFSLLIGLQSHPALGSVGAIQIKASVNEFLIDYTKDLAQEYGKSARIEHHIGRLDPRLALVDCPLPLDTQLKSINRVGRISLKVSCQEQSLWSIYVPAEIKVHQKVVSVANPVARGVQLTANMLQFSEQDISRLNGSYFRTTEEVVGMQAKRLLKPGKPLLASHLEHPILVKRGDAVMMTANSGNLTVKIPGIALSDGHKGEQITVRNRQSRNTVEARVTGPGLVSVAM